MTGFGRGFSETEHGRANVEVSGVNRKQAEVVIQGIRELSEVETRIRKAALASISRGRLQVSIQLEPADGETGGITLDPVQAKAFEETFRSLSALLGREVVPEASDFIKAPGIIQLEDKGIDPDHAWEIIAPALETALGQFIAMRAREGEELAADLEKRLQELRSIRDEIGRLSPERTDRYRAMLMKRLSDAGLELDLADDRVQREIALFADRCDISEELTRLDAHFTAFTGFLSSDEPVGRPLDFLCQELNREFNTVGSKASDAAIAQLVVSAKTELEKIREQVQNVE